MNSRCRVTGSRTLEPQQHHSNTTARRRMVPPRRHGGLFVLLARRVSDHQAAPIWNRPVVEAALVRRSNHAAAVGPSADVGNEDCRYQRGNDKRPEPRRDRLPGIIPQQPTKRRSQVFPHEIQWTFDRHAAGRRGSPLAQVTALPHVALRQSFPTTRGVGQTAGRTQVRP